MADQLNARLRHLAFRLHLAAAHAQALPGIGQPQRPRRRRQAGRGQPADLRRGVRTETQHALAFGVHHPKRLLGGGRTRAGEQRILKLQQRWLDALKTVRGKRLHQPFHRARLQLRLRRQHVAHAGGQQSGVVHRLIHHKTVFCRGAALYHPGPASTKSHADGQFIVESQQKLCFNRTQL